MKTAQGMTNNIKEECSERKVVQLKTETRSVLLTDNREEYFIDCPSSSYSLYSFDVVSSLYSYITQILPSIVKQISKWSSDQKKKARQKRR